MDFLGFCLGSALGLLLSFIFDILELELKEKEKKENERTEKKEDEI